MTNSTRIEHPQTVLLAVHNMHCSSCVKKIQSALARHGDSVQMRADPTTRTLSLSWDSQQQPLQTLIKSLAEAGFPAELVTIESSQLGPKPNLRRIGIAVLFTMQTMMLALAGYLGADQGDVLVKNLMDYGQWIAATPVVLYAGWPFVFGAWRDISSRQVTMDLPVGLAIAAAYSFSAANVVRGSGVLWFDSATMFVSLLLIARLIEQSGRQRATQALSQLFRHQKHSARRVRNGQVTELPSHEIEIGDEIEVHPTEIIPVDGVLLNSAVVSESVLSGESTPLNKPAGAPVYAGSIAVGTEALRVRTSAKGADTTLGRITQLMHQALTTKPRVQQLADRVAAYFVFCVLSLALIGGLIWAYWDIEKGISVALTVLVSSCPCALSLATPAALAAAMSRLAKRGIMVLKLDGLLNAKTISHVLFDKTGTLTTNKLNITGLRLTGSLNQQQALEIAAGLERISRHPIASAFDELSAAPIEQAKTSVAGVSGYYQKQLYRLQASHSEELERYAIGTSTGQIYLSLYAGTSLQAILSLCAPLRQEAKIAIQRLQQRGITPHILSGDAEQAVATAAQQLGINSQAGTLKAAEKLSVIQQLQQTGQAVAAVGDGINDGPLLAAADLGIAMGSGAAQAKSGADIILDNNNLNLINEVISESTTLHQRIKQNIAWAIAYNVTVFPLALSGTLSPWVAALGMASSSILVVANALRQGRQTAGSNANNHHRQHGQSTTQEAALCQPSPY